MDAEMAWCVVYVHVPYRTVLYCTVQYSTEQYSVVKYSIVLHCAVQHFLPLYLSFILTLSSILSLSLSLSLSYSKVCVFSTDLKCIGQEKRKNIFKLKEVEAQY